MGPYRQATRPPACPRCDRALTARSVADASVEICPQCEGIFVPPELVPRFLDPFDLGGEILEPYRGRSAAAPRETRVYLPCPRCEEPMNRRVFAEGSRVIVDVCRGHGFWFDAQELEAVAAFSEAGGLERAAAREAERQRQREHRDAMRRDAEQLSQAAGYVSGERSRLVAWLLDLLHPREG